MPQLQWMGQLPEKRSPLAEIIKAGVGPGIEAYKGAQERGIKLVEISYEKKKDAADTIVKMFQDATPQQKEQALGESAPDTKIRDLILETHGQETIDTLLGTTGRSMADKLREVEAWLTTGRVKDPVMGGTMEVGKEDMNWNVMMELGANWKKEYPHLASMYTTHYPITLKKEGEEKESRFRLPWRERGPSTAEMEERRGRVEGTMEEKVMVISPEGIRGRIPKSQLSDALAQGYKRAR